MPYSAISASTVKSVPTWLCRTPLLLPVVPPVETSRQGSSKHVAIGISVSVWAAMTAS
jgi:hypothetical protein